VNPETVRTSQDKAASPNVRPDQGGPATEGRRRADPRWGRPGSVRNSVVLLTGSAVGAVVLLALTDGLAAAATGLALFAAAGFGVARYVVGGGTQDSGYRRSVRLLGGRTLALGQWEPIVRKSLGEGGERHFAAVLRPQLQGLFAARLAQRHGVELYRAPQRAAALIGPELWPWIDPAGPPPEPAIPEHALRALLDRLEALEMAPEVDPVSEDSATASRTRTAKPAPNPITSPDSIPPPDGIPPTADHDTSQ
jgi:hypothetical protein